MVGAGLGLVQILLGPPQLRPQLGLVPLGVVQLLLVERNRVGRLLHTCLGGLQLLLKLFLLLRRVRGGVLQLRQLSLQLLSLCGKFLLGLPGLFQYLCLLLVLLVQRFHLPLQGGMLGGERLQTVGVALMQGLRLLQLGFVQGQFCVDVFQLRLVFCLALNGKPGGYGSRGHGRLPSDE